jgi:SAM-dependent methyltransferase
MVSGLQTFTRYWFPHKVEKAVIGPQLARFYSERTDYHAMTAVEDKCEHPQVQLLFSLLKPEYTAAEFGCGGGVVLSALGPRVRRAIGFDIGQIALSNARRRPGPHWAVLSDVARVPLANRSVDLAYSFEVLEHVWDPAGVIREMLRVLKPGGTLLFTTPNGYAMNLHLPLRREVRILHHVGAACTLAMSAVRRLPYENIPPDLEANPVYPDCDQITRIHPRSLIRFAEGAGCRVERLETFFFQRAKAPSEADRQRYERLESHPFYRWHGDHILFVGTKVA